jgi:AraC-like DNA-binding protein/CheY-like chemotaxis protein
MASILMVNDDAVSLATSATLLRMAGHAVTTAATGHEGVNAALAHAFDVLLIDLRLPDLDGNGVVRLLKSRGVKGRMIITTAFPTFESSYESGASGADGFVDGPIFEDELVLLVQRALAEPRPVTRTAPPRCQAARDGGKVDERIAQVLRIIQNEMRSLPTVAGMARRVGLSESRLRHLFLAQVGVPISKYILSRRLGASARYLSESFEHVRQIAFRVGIINLRHFRRAFRAMYGLTPREYRRQFGHARGEQHEPGAASMGR